MFGLDKTAARIVSVILLVALLCLVGFGVSYCRKTEALKVAGAEKTLGDARSGAAQDASEIRDVSDARNEQINNTVKDSTDAVRNAPDAASRNAAALRGLCRVDPSSSPDCRLLDANR